MQDVGLVGGSHWQHDNESCTCAAVATALHTNRTDPNFRAIM